MAETEISNLKRHNKEKLKKCPKCGCVWEIHHQSKTILSYPDFPSYGLPKEICGKCKKEE